MSQLKKKVQFDANTHVKPCQINCREKHFSGTNNTSHLGRKLKDTCWDTAKGPIIWQRINSEGRQRTHLEPDTHSRLPTHHEYRKPILFGSWLKSRGGTARSGLLKGVFCWVYFWQEVQHLVPYLRVTATSSMKPHHPHSARPQGVLRRQPQLHGDGAREGKRQQRGGGRGRGEAGGGGERGRREAEHWSILNWTESHYLRC